jgi:isopenicillin N synthase-like dioxygenase
LLSEEGGYDDELAAGLSALVSSLNKESDGVDTQQHQQQQQQQQQQRNPFQSPQSGSLAQKTSILTCLGYQAGSRHKKKHHKKKRAVHPLVASHTDIGVITVLLYDGGDCCASLQRLDAHLNDKDVKFEDVLLPSVIPDDPIFVVNIADCLSMLTRQRLPSTIHRVVPMEGAQPRNCLALFVGLDPNQILKLDDGSEISYQEWRKSRIKESQDILKQKNCIE